MNKTVTVIRIGIGAWSIGLIIALVTNSPVKIIYTCILGIALGCIGIVYSTRRDVRESKANENK